MFYTLCPLQLKYTFTVHDNSLKYLGNSGLLIQERRLWDLCLDSDFEPSKHSINSQRKSSCDVTAFQ